MDRIKKADEKNFSLDDLIKNDRKTKKPVKKQPTGVHAKRKTLATNKPKKMVPKQQQGKPQPNALKARRQPIHKDKQPPKQPFAKKYLPPKGAANQARGPKHSTQKVPFVKVSSGINHKILGRGQTGASCASIKDGH